MYKYILSFLYFVAVSNSKLPPGYQGKLRTDRYHHIKVHYTDKSPRRFVDVDTDYALRSRDEYNSSYWLQQAQETIKAKLAAPVNRNVAHNIIFFLGDGCSYATWLATRLYKAQQLGIEFGESYKLAVEYFPYCAQVKTYCVDAQVPDSACTATAYFTGVKCNMGTIGVNAQVLLNDCNASTDKATHTVSIVKQFQAAGMRTGIVTTARITDASPAGAYANTANRKWECDADVLSDDVDVSKCPDIAYQLINGETGKNINVILGGGRQKFIPENTSDEDGNRGQRADGVNLINLWEKNKGDKGIYVHDRKGLNSVTKSDYLLGLFSSSTMSNVLDNDSTQPSLSEMTATAIKSLEGPKGYFLFVEGAKIDHGHHSTQARIFDEAISKAVEMTNSENTLIVVSSDHSHGMSISGYPSRGSDIFDIAGTDSDGIPYTTISYNGGQKGFQNYNGARHDPSKDDLQDPKYTFPALVRQSSAMHSGDDVGLYCSGPWEELCTGVIEQNVIPLIMVHAAGITNNDSS